MFKEDLVGVEKLCTGRQNKSAATRIEDHHHTRVRTTLRKLDRKRGGKRREGRRQPETSNQALKRNSNPLKGIKAKELAQEGLRKCDADGISGLAKRTAQGTLQALEVGKKRRKLRSGGTKRQKFIVGV